MMKLTGVLSIILASLLSTTSGDKSVELESENKSSSNINFTLNEDFSWENSQSFWEDLELYIDSLPTKMFMNDPILIKLIEYPSGEILFRHLDKERMARPLYSTKLFLGVNHDNNVYILRPLEDNIQVIRHKRQFVVLKRTSTYPTLYHVSYLYVKDPLPNDLDDDSQRKKFGGFSTIIEFDTWDNRGSVEYISQLFGWTDCSHSIVVSCLPKNPTNNAGKITTTSQGSVNLKLYSSLDGDKHFAYHSVWPSEAADYFQDMHESDSSFSYIVDTIYKLIHITPSSHLDPPPSQNASVPPDYHSSFVYLKSQINFSEILKPYWSGPLNIWKEQHNEHGTFASSLLPALHSLVGAEDISTLLQGLSSLEQKALMTQLQQPNVGGLGGMVTAVYDTKDYEEASYKAMFDNFRMSDCDIKKQTYPTDYYGKIIERTVSMRTNMIHRPGWLTRGLVRSGDNVTLEHKQDEFLGFGPCLQENGNLSQVILRPNSKEELLNGYLIALRLHCIPESKQNIVKLFYDGYLDIIGDVVVFTLNNSNWDHIKINEEKLTQLGLSLEFLSFAQVFRETLQTPAIALSNVTGLNISLSMYIMTQFVCRGMQNTFQNSILRMHYIRLFRSFLKTMKTIQTKLMQDYIILNDCGNPCLTYLKDNQMHRRLIGDIINFFRHGLDPVLSGDDACRNLKIFLRINHN